MPLPLPIPAETPGLAFQFAHPTASISWHLCSRYTSTGCNVQRQHAAIDVSVRPCMPWHAHLALALPPLKAEWCCDNANCQNAHLTCCVGDHWGCTTASASTHASLWRCSRTDHTLEQKYCPSIQQFLVQEAATGRVKDKCSRILPTHQETTNSIMCGLTP